MPRIRLRNLPSLAPLRHTNYAVVTVGGFVSQLGTWSQIVGIGWAAQQLTDSALLVSVAFGAEFLPSLLVAPFGGVIADRLDRRLVAIVGNVGMALPAATIGVLLALDALTIWGLIALALVGGVMQSMTQPATSALVPHLVPAEEIPAAVGLSSALQNLSRFLGASLAGLIISSYGISTAFYVNAASYFAVVVAWLVVRLDVPRPAPNEEGFMGTLLGGLRYARSHADLRDVLLLNAVVILCLVHQPLLPLITSRLLDAGSGTYGVLNSLIGVGAIVGAFLAGRRASPASIRATFGAAACGIGLTIAVVGVSRSITLTGAVLIVYGGALFTVLTTTMSTVMLRTPDGYRGRVMALQSMSISGMLPLNALIAGLLAQQVGVETTVVGAGVLLAAYATWFILTGRLVAVGDRTVPVTASGSVAEELPAKAVGDGAGGESERGGAAAGA